MDHNEAAATLAGIPLEGIAIAVFLLALLLIAFEWLHRAEIAAAGAVIFILLGIIDQESAIEHIDWETIGLLAGMMLVVELARPTGAFAWLALQAAKLSRGRPIMIVLMMSLITGVLSAFLDNLTTILLIAPLTFMIAETLGMRVVPMLIIEIIASNIGGTATLIGDPPNIIIAGYTDLSFNSFMVNLALPAVVILVAVVLTLYGLFRKSFAVDPEKVPALQEIDPGATLAKGRDLWVPLGILVGTLVFFFVHHLLHVEPVTVALTGAVAMILFVSKDLTDTLVEIDWATLMFFAGLFVMVGGLEAQGTIESIAVWVQDATGGDRVKELVAVIWVAGIGSGFVDNIPFTTAMLPVVDTLSPGTIGELSESGAFEGDSAHWWALSLGACMGGNLTIIAAAANVACQGIAEKNGKPIKFLEFMKWGVVATTISLIISTGYVLLRYTDVLI